MGSKDTKSAANKKAAGPTNKGLKVIARRDSFRRAGRVFTGEATVIPLSDLTEEDVALLLAEPLLVVQEVDIEEPAPGAAA